MNKIGKIAVIAALALILVMTLIACNDGDDYEYVYQTDEYGETVTDTNGEPVKETDGEGNPVTVPAGETESQSGVFAAGADTDTGWGELITPNS